MLTAAPLPNPPRQLARALRGSGTILAALALTAFLLSLPLPAVDANVMGAWGRTQSYRTASVLTFHLLTTPWSLASGDLPRAGLLPATLVFFAIPVLRRFKARR